MAPPRLLQIDPLVARDDSQRAFAGEYRAGDDAQAIAQRSTLRQAQQLSRPHRPRHGVQLGNLLGRAVEPRAAIFDEVAIADLAVVDLGIGIEGVVGQLLQDQPAKLTSRNASALLQTVEGSKQRPVRPLGHNQNRRIFRVSMSHFKNQTFLDLPVTER
jgi:hypothetical protein